MKIRAIHTYEFGPLGTQSFDFTDSWSGDTAAKILLSGPNGCGKSTLLRGVAMAWEALGDLLQGRREVVPLPLPESAGIVLLLEQLPSPIPDIMLYFASSSDGDSLKCANRWVESLGRRFPDHVQIGQSTFTKIYSASPTDVVHQKLSLPEQLGWLDQWTSDRQKMLVSPEPSLSPNMLFLDAEERHWVTPTSDIGEIRSENLKQRWLSSYRATDNWDGQVESALLNMKVASEERFMRLIEDMNRFLSGKQISKHVKFGENRLRIELGGGNTHGIEQLSSGERQVLILLYMVDRWLENGGIALIDEPDLFLHPSLISGFMAQLEKMVEDRGGQLIITSHIPDVWERYEAVGKRVLLGSPE